MNWSAIQGIAEAAGVLLTIGAIIYGAGRLAGSFENLANAVQDLVKKFESLFSQTNENTKEIAIHEERITRLEQK